MQGHFADVFGRLRRAYWVFILLIVVGENLSVCRFPGGAFWACQSQEKYIGSVLDIYAADHQHRYPNSLATLVPKYLVTVPTCPSAGSDTYSASYQVNQSRTRYRFCCQGDNHAHYASQNEPCYDSKQGLQDDHAPSDDFRCSTYRPLPWQLWDTAVPLFLLLILGVTSVWVALGGPVFFWFPLFEGTLLYFLLLHQIQTSRLADLPLEWAATVALAVWLAGPLVTGLWVAWRSQGRLTSWFFVPAITLAVGPAAYLTQSLEPNIHWVVLFIYPVATVVLPGLWVKRRLDRPARVVTGT
jgi:hypothetical protein